ncbi:MAG: hypothetical protein PHW76_06405 [Alphaproteobacteria bacterium]|nr:hypothetical protein [Alphaproteobacteria bacterium]
MADYYTQIVVQQTIPEKLISPFERLLLGKIFETESCEDGIYYFASNGASCDITLNRMELKQTLERPGERSRLRPFIAARLKDTAPDNEFVDLDLSTAPSGEAHIILLQDIVRRAKGDLPYLTIACAFTCNKMRPDGFGGMGIIITPARVLYRSTFDFFESFERRYECNIRAKERDRKR